MQWKAKEVTSGKIDLWCYQSTRTGSSGHCIQCIPRELQCSKTIHLWPIVKVWQKECSLFLKSGTKELADIGPYSNIPPRYCSLAEPASHYRGLGMTNISIDCFCREGMGMQLNSMPLDLMWSPIEVSGNSILPDWKKCVIRNGLSVGYCWLRKHTWGCIGHLQMKAHIKLCRQANGIKVDKIKSWK